MEYVASNSHEQQIIDYFLESYKEPGFIARRLYNHFFANIEKALQSCNDAQHILEVGCGLGESSLRIAEMLNNKSFEVSEFNQDYVKILKNSNFPLKVEQESVYQLKRQDESFDVLLFLEVLEHLDNVQLAVSELFRVSKKYVILSVPNEPLWSFLNFCRGKYWKDFGNTPGHINHFNKKSLAKVVAPYGTIQQVLTPTPWIIMLIEKHAK